MIYVTYKNDNMFGELRVNNVWSILKDNSEDVEGQYSNFMLEKAEKLNLVVNPHYLTAMNYEDNNTHLSKKEYDLKVKEWSKIRRMWNIDKFIADKLNGYKEEFREIIRL